MRYIVFDTETTGIDPDRQAVEFAMLEINENLEVVGEASSLLNVTVPISAEAQAVHGISHEMLKDCLFVEEWVEQNLGGPLEGDVVLIGHRVDFDKPLFAPFGNVVHTLDTLTYAFEYFPEAPNKKLDTLKECLGLPGGGLSHRAMADALTCHQLLGKIKEVTGRSLHELATTPFTVHYCPWGKHAGTLLVELPRGYRQWMLGLDGLEPNLRRSLEQVALLDPAPRPMGSVGAEPPKFFGIPRRS